MGSDEIQQFFPIIVANVSGLVGYFVTKSKEIEVSAIWTPSPSYCRFLW